MSEDIFDVTKDIAEPRILIVEDMGALAEVMGDILENSGAKVKIVGDGVAGKQAVGTFHPDIIITDQKLPKLRGDEMVLELRKEGNQKPVIMLSGFDTEDAVSNALKTGIFYFLSKPVSKEILITVIQRALKTEADRMLSQAMVDTMIEKWNTEKPDRNISMESLTEEAKARIDQQRKKDNSAVS